MPCGGKIILKDKDTTIYCVFVVIETAAYGGWFSRFGFAAVFKVENKVGIDENISVGYKYQSAEFLMEYENMNRQEEYQSDGDAAMKDQNDGELVQDHAEETGSKRNDDQPQ